MSDIVAWLRERSHVFHLAYIGPELREAADEIERLRAENAALRDMLAPQSPIVKVTVRDNEIVSASFYSPSLPDGTHDLYCEQMNPSGGKVERWPSTESPEPDMRDAK